MIKFVSKDRKSESSNQVSNRSKMVNIGQSSLSGEQYINNSRQIDSSLKTESNDDNNNIHQNDCSSPITAPLYKKKNGSNELSYELAFPGGNRQFNSYSINNCYVRIHGDHSNKNSSNTSKNKTEVAA